MIRILNIIGSVGYGGAETFLMNIYRKIDREKIQFDFLICGDDREGYADEIRNLGGKIFTVPTKKESLFRNLYSIYSVVKKQNYKIVWRHTNSLFKGIDLVAARLGGAKRTILHSHNTAAGENEMRMGRILSPLINVCVTDCMACGEDAGKYMFKNRDFLVIHNGIDTESYIFDLDIRSSYREKYGLTDALVLGHVGRFEKQKNHSFLLELVECIKKHNENVKLVLVGEGTLLDTIKQETKKRHLEKQVLFLGKRTDVNNLMQMFDVFLLPSLFEGFPVVMVEAQAADLPCLVSDTIDRNVSLTDNVVFETLETPAEVWAEKILNMVKESRISRLNEIRRAGYDAGTIAMELEEYFLESDRKDA